MAPIGTLTGTFLAPGWSKNQRLYTPDLIADSVADMSTRLEAGQPIAMMACHDTNSTLEQVAAIRKVWTDADGAAKYEAEIPDTRAGRDLLALTDDTEQDRFLNSVSIYGGWVGGTRKVEQDGRTGETGDKLVVTRVDFVDDPGIPAARLDAQSAPAPGEAELIESLGDSFTPITESAPPAQFHDAAETAPTGEAATEQALTTENAPQAAPAPAAKGSAYAQLAAIRDAANEAMVRISAFTGDYDTDVDITSYGVDNTDLPAHAAALGKATADAIAHIEDPGAASSAADAAATDDGADDALVAVLCSACMTDLPSDASYCPSCGAAVSTPENAPTTGGAAELGPTTCGGCGGDVPAAAKFCPNCGAETKTKDDGSESAPGTQEVPVTEQQTSESAAQIAAIVAEAFKQAGVGVTPAAPVAPAAATETAPTTPTAPAAPAAPVVPAAPAASTEAAPAAPATEGKSVADQIQEALAAQRETDRAAAEASQKALIEGMTTAMTQGLTGLRDELRTELQGSGQAGQRVGYGSSPQERIAAIPEAAAPLHTLPAHERDRAHQDGIAGQMIASGIYTPQFAEAVRTQSRFAG